MGRKYDVEDRLVVFSSSVTDIVEAIPTTRIGNYIGGQLTRCGLAPALLYGEAQSAESRDDFIHKMKIALKKLKENRICLKLITMRKLVLPLENVANENEELIAIISKSIETARKNKASAS